MLGLEKKPEQQKQGQDQPMFLGQQKHPGSVNKSTELTNEVNNISRRLRVLEERYTNLRKKTQVTDQNMLHTSKRVSTELQLTNATLNDLQKEVEDIKDKMRLIIKELKMTATKEEVHTLNKYINLWEPVNFVTQNEVEKIISRMLDDRLRKLK